VQFGWHLTEMQGHFCHVVAVILQCTRAFTGDAYTALHQSKQRVKARYFCAGAVNQILFFMTIKGL
ncbi:MAG: hypothetical protein ABR572_13620, partial [Cryomorphaceae bacterium]